MDIVTFLLSATGAIVLLGLGLFLWFILGKGTSTNARYASLGGKLMAFAGAMILIVPMVSGYGTEPVDVTGVDPEFDFSIVWVVDATTAVISGDFSQTDEAASGEYALSYDENGNTDAVSLTNTCTAASACTWDAFAFTNTITAEAKSEWVGGAKVTSVLGASIDSDILDWGIISNVTGTNRPFVDRDPLGNSGLIWVDGAAANKPISRTSVISLNEFSPGESITSAGLYFAVNEDDYSSLFQVPTGIWSDSWNIVYTNEYGFSHTVVLTLTITTA